MNKVITKIDRNFKVISPKKKVAAYARVSSAKDAMLNSLSSQVSHYKNYINKNQKYEFCGVYVDEGLTGTSNNRPEFNRLIKDCKQGKIDLILTKSISRFARNTLTLLEAVRELKEIGVDVYFEKENIHSMSGDGELMLTILASFAQEESLSVSENCKWRIRSNFKQGIPPNIKVYGYRIINNELVVAPKEAEVIKNIFEDYLNGMGKVAIVNKLNSLGIDTLNNKTWRTKNIYNILRNEMYTGNLILQKTFINNHVDKKKCFNKGELPQYHVKNNHKGIIDRETFNKVQLEIEKRKQKYANTDTSKKYPLSGKIHCSICGSYYRRKIANIGTKYEKVIWICNTYNTKGKSFCESKAIQEEMLMEIIDYSSIDKISNILVLKDKVLLIKYKDGKEIKKTWENKRRTSK